nr:reverse transcriptase domain-containing protein [Tanacetum cinerariifolium]
SIVYTDHSTLKYLINKQDAKPRLLRWVLFFQAFDITILDKKKGSENLAADHLSRLENPHKDMLGNKDINENFSLETLGSLSCDSTLWAIISDRRTHFCNDQFTRVMIKYEVTHQRTVGENQASWSDKLDDALWAFCTAFKTLIGCTPYKLVYGKSCHLPIELEHRAYWALRHVNFNLKTTGDHRKLQLNELNELRDQAYENSVITKRGQRSCMTLRLRTAFSMLVIKSCSSTLVSRFSQGSQKLIGQALSPSPRIYPIMIEVSRVRYVVPVHMSFTSFVCN